VGGGGTCSVRFVKGKMKGKEGAVKKGASCGVADQCGGEFKQLLSRGWNKSQKERGGGLVY